LKRSGALEDFPALSDEQSHMMAQMKDATLQQIDKYRTSIRRRLNPTKIQAFFENEKERMTAIGLASGAAVGLLFK
jgi:hypothetical protein